MSTDVVQYAVLGLISARTEGAHGYQLKTEFDTLYGDFWSLNYGQLYRTLDRWSELVSSKAPSSSRVGGRAEGYTGSPQAAVKVWTIGSCYRRRTSLAPCATTSR